ncbi:MAG TPA: 2Fe-2S iron-sulfur cluster-binding protein, partial [Gaiellaceae bacterium]|nr:2Fe-2S iron-sulfur cluster-binding protein [Gaiellaceae bacterium]
MRLPPQPRERIDRTQRILFTFDGKAAGGYAGDTIGSALYASGQRIFSRSFKYHRPRGLLCCSGHCPNCMMTVDGVPNVRTCVEPIRPGAVVEPQNVWGSLDRDLLAMTDKVGGPFTPVGFYYRTMIRPRRLWPLYEKMLRNLAGLGQVRKGGTGHRRYDVEHRRARVLVIGGGESGRVAALAAATLGPGVVLVDEMPNLRSTDLEGVEVLAPARALGIWEGNLVPVDGGDVLYRFRAERIIVATGALDQPLVFPGNDLIGVMLPGAVRRLIRDFAIGPGSRAVVLAGDERDLEIADDLREVGVAVPRVVNLAGVPLSEIRAHGRRGEVRGVTLEGRDVECDLVVASAGRQPAYSLLAQAGGRVEYDSARGIFVPTELPAGIEALG